MNERTEGLQVDSPSTVTRSAVELLSSMRFAISLLSIICIASVIGTVLKQQEPAVNYVNQFGPFWAELFLSLKLNAVYSAGWFLLILAFLVASTSLCIARNAPKILADLRAYKENLREQSLRAFHHRAEGEVAGPPAEAARRIGEALAAGGWKVRLQSRDNGWMVAARAGAANKVGYLAAHSAIVLVCVGGLLDGDLVVRAQMWFNDKSTYSGSGLIAEVPAQHRLSSTNPTFRGNVMVAEGMQASTAILSQSDGVLLQELPFSIELRKFIVEYYSTGMPKLFASEILIHDRDSGETVPARVEVNHPARHRGIEIYQSSFDDGGSTVKLRAMPMGGESKAFEVEGTVGSSTQLSRGSGEDADKLTLEFTGLRVINVENFADASSSASGADTRKVDLRESVQARLGAANKTVSRKELRNVGPSVTYKLRDAAGQAREFHNYMLPVDFGDGPVFLLGLRDTPSEAFRYLRVPADDKGEAGDFQRLRAALRDLSLREQAVRRYATRATDSARPDLHEQLAQSTRRALALFAGDGVAGAKPTGQGSARGEVAGLQALSDFMQSNVPEADRARAGEVLVRILNGALFELLQVARERDALPRHAADERMQSFMSHAVIALSDLPLYPAPMALMLSDFKQVQASVFQVARAPGRNIVYLGCALLILGVFAMLYVRERRLWVWLASVGGDAAGRSQASMALSTNRQTLDADREFAMLKDKLIGKTKA